MANQTWKDMGLKIDNASGTITDISAYVNSQSLQSSIAMLEETGMGVTTKQVVSGMADIKIPLNGWLNSTTEGIFGPVISGTSVAKTVNFQQKTGRHFTGEFLPSSVQISGNPGELQAWSCELTLDGALTRTSVAAT